MGESDRAADRWNGEAVGRLPETRENRRRRLRMSERGDQGLLVTLDPGTARQQALEVGNPEDLHRIFLKTMPDEVLLDLHLPIHLGWSLLRSLKSTCPRAEILAHVHSRIGEPRFYSVSVNDRGLSLRPFDGPRPTWGCGNDG